MINQILTIDKSPIQQQLSELWNVSPADEDYMQRVEMILMEFNMVFSRYATSDQTRMRHRILKKLDLLRQTKDPFEVFTKIISIDIGIQFLDPSLSNIGKYAPLEEAHALKNLSKKIYIPICSIVERYEKLSKLFDFPGKEKLMENLLLRRDKSILSLSSRVSLYVNFPEIYPIKNQLFNFIKEHPHNVLGDFLEIECKNVKKIIVNDCKDLSILNLFPNLTDLKIIRACNLHDSVFAAIAHLKLTNLKIDDIEDDGTMDGHGLGKIANMPLKSLTLSHYGIKDVVMSHIKLMTSVENLYIGCSGITDAGLYHLENATHLKTLSLICNPITSKGIFYLRNLALKKLYLAWIDEFKKGMGDVVSSLLQMKNLNSLDLRGAKLTAKELLQLSDLPLEFIDLRQSLRSLQNCLSLEDLYSFALSVKQKQNINVTIISGSVLEWMEYTLKANDMFHITHHKI